MVNSIRYFYDTEGTLTKKIIAPTGGEAQTVSYEQNEDNTVVRYKVPAPEEVSGERAITAHSKTDSFGRKVFDELQLGTGFVSRQFSYHAGEVTPEHEENRKLKSSPTTNLVSQITFSGGDTISYTYDAEERITSVVETYTDGEDQIVRTTEYTYDALGQLLTETVNGTVVNTMTYDNYGNIRTKNGVAYTYGDSAWKDKLTAYNGKTITYDAQGNPLRYRGNPLTWEKGRQLKAYVHNTYTYNANGIRTSKTISTGKHEYILDGTKILRETWGNNTLIPLYDNEDSVCGILYNDEPFYFRKNLQGDIIAIVNDQADVVARYSYDAWGVPTTLFDTSGCSIATVNPFRYRSYYYDPETGLYYLQSRYYDPVVGRFINADMPEFTLLSINITEHNLIAYCINNPVNLTDPTGNVAILDDLIYLSIVGLYAIATLLISLILSPQFQKIWISLCAAVGNGLSWIGACIVNAGLAVWNWIKRQVKSVADAMAYMVIAIAHARIQYTIKKTSKIRYWTATLKKNYVDIGRPISFGTAVSEVSRGRNVFAVTRLEAKAVAKAAYSNKSPVGPEIDRGKENIIGYYYHFHVHKRKRQGHVFFLFW